MGETRKSNGIAVAIVMAMLGVLIIITLGISLNRHFERLKVLVGVESLKVDIKLAENWMTAVKKNNAREAKRLASDMVTGFSFRAPPGEYLKIAEHNGFTSLFFNPPFEDVDFLFWSEAFKERDIAFSVEKNSDHAPEKLFAAIHKRVQAKPYPPDERRFRFPSQVWEDQRGDVSDIYYLFARLLAQHGYECDVVFLFNPTSKEPDHMVAEVRRENLVCACDFFSGNFWGGVSVAKLATQSEKLKKIWRPEWVSALNRRVYTVPAPPLAYREINQALDKALRDTGIEELPVFGASPAEELDKLRKKLGALPPNCQCLYWPAPFMKFRTCPEIPKFWLKEAKKK